MMLINFDEYFNRINKYFESFGKDIIIPEDAVKNEEVVEKNGVRTTTVTYKKEGFSYTKTTVEHIPNEKQQLYLNMKKDMEKAISEERFEDAAVIRDKIKELNE